MRHCLLRKAYLEVSVHPNGRVTTRRRTSSWRDAHVGGHGQYDHGQYLNQHANANPPTQRRSGAVGRPAGEYRVWLHISIETDRRWRGRRVTVFYDRPEDQTSDSGRTALADQLKAITEADSDLAIAQRRDIQTALAQLDNMLAIKAINELVYAEQAHLAADQAAAQSAADQQSLATARANVLALAQGPSVSDAIARAAGYTAELRAQIALSEPSALTSPTV